MGLDLSKLAKVFSVIAGLLPLVVQLVVAVENEIKGVGQGATKKETITPAVTDLVTKAADMSSGGMKNTLTEVATAAPVVSELIESGVALAKATGLIADKADPTGVSVQGTQ